MTTFQRLGEIFLQRRKALGKTQAQIARDAGLRQEEISRLENARLPDFTVSKLLKLAHALHLDVSMRPREMAKLALDSALTECETGDDPGRGEF